MPLNFGGQKRSGAFDMVWPPAIVYNKGKNPESTMINHSDNTNTNTNTRQVMT